MPDPDPTSPDAAKGRLFSFDNLKWLIGTLSLPLVLLLLSTHFQEQSKRNSDSAIRAANDRANADSKIRLYSELLNKREEADNTVRRDVFDKLMNRYLSPAHADLDSKVVVLELLALNFHDSLNLSPLFWQLDRQIDKAAAPRRMALRAQLDRVALAVKNRQVALLAPDDNPATYHVELAQVPPLASDGNCGALPTELAQTTQQRTVLEVAASYQDTGASATPKQHQRTFYLEIECHDKKERRLSLIVEDGTSRRRWHFWLDTYDFPLVNFTRVSRDERFALVLDNYEDGFAKLRFVYFPSARGGAKDKPYIADVMSQLLPAGAALPYEVPAAGKANGASASGPGR